LSPRLQGLACLGELGAPLDVDVQLALVEELGEALQSTSLETSGGS